MINGQQYLKAPMRSLVRNTALSLAFLLCHAAAHASAAQDHPGFWLGKIKVPNGPELRLGAELFVRADGRPWASLASPDQGSYDIPVKAIRAEPGDAFVLDVGFGKLELTWVKDHFDGKWMQGGDALPLTLVKVNGFQDAARPQTPKAPFPYRDQELAIVSRDGVMLGATLSVPNAPARPNAVVLVAGSGPQTRHVQNAGHKLFDVLADHLARQGIAVLRYDKRGIGRSTGDYHGHTTVQLADDAYAAVQALKATGRFRHVGLLGHSEGSQVAAAVAAAHPEAVDFIVSMAGVGLPGLELMLLQDRQYALDQGASPQDLERLMPYVRNYYDTVLATADGEPRIAALKALQAGLPAADRELIEARHMNAGTLSPAMAAEPFLPVLLKDDPRAYWRAIHRPVLVLGGSLDHQVPSEQNVAGIVAALKTNAHAKVESAVLPSLNHGFQTAQTGKEDEYATIDETMAPAAMQKVAAFVRRQ
jgi:pimeloyl-ACP methyl ester carboxylesterase